MTFTELTKLLESGKSRQGGISGEQLQALGVERNPRKGWKDRLCARGVTPEQVAEFLRLKDAHLPKIQPLPPTTTYVPPAPETNDIQDVLQFLRSIADEIDLLRTDVAEIRQRLIDLRETGVPHDRT